MSSRTSKKRHRLSAPTLRGRFRPHPRGFGFVDFDEPHPGPDGPVLSVFVPPPLARRLVADDVVDVECSFADGRTTATRAHVVSRPRRLLVGTAVSSSAGLMLRPDASLSTADWPLADWPGLRPRVGVLAALPRRGRPAQVLAVFDAASPAFARALAATRALGAPSPDLPEDALEILHADCLAAASGSELAYPPLPVPCPPVSRRDCTSLAAFTVDSEQSRDLDDAIFAEEVPGGVRVQIHITDVAARVPAGSPLDAYARLRATSIYLAEATFPMLPRRLSESELSLLEGEPRDTLAVAFIVPLSGPQAGVPSQVEVFAASIRSHARLSYRQVEGHLAGSRLPDSRVASAVDHAASAAHALRAARDRRDTLSHLFEPAAFEITIGPDGRPVPRLADTSPNAQALVEALMVAANEAVASWLVSHGQVGLFRTHVGVDPACAELLTSVDDRFDPASGTAHVLDRLRHLDQQDPDLAAVFSALVTSSMARAAYGTSPDHHAGLDSRPYCHFTSPLRRYADLVNHRIIHAVLSGRPSGYGRAKLDALAGYLNGRCSAAGFAESAERSLLWSLYMNDLLASSGELRESATVTRLSPKGASVRLSRLGVSGFVPAAALGPAWSVDESGVRARSRGSCFHLGQRLDVMLSGLDSPTGRPSFVPV